MGDVKNSLWNPPPDRFRPWIPDSPQGVPPPPYELEYNPPARPVPSPPSWSVIRSAARENFERSRLLRLPDNIIARIMYYTDTPTILHLRHISRIFMRIFSQSPLFKNMRYHKRQPGLSCVWKTPVDIFDWWVGKAFCSSCTEVRRDDLALINGMDQRWCSRCLTRHSDMHFSDLQRGAFDHERICIGREGAVSICSHFSLRWDQVVHLARRSQNNFINCTLHDSKGLDCKQWKCTYSHKVGVRVTRESDGRYRIIFSSFSHIPFGSNPHWFAVYNAIHEAINPEDKQFFVPDRRFAGCNPLRAFDPNHCSCLDWGIHPSEEATSPTPGFKWHLSSRNCGNWRREANEFRGDYSGAPPSGGSTDRCSGRHHGIAETVGNRRTWISFLKCEDDANMLVLAQHTSIFAESPTEPCWEDLLDPVGIQQGGPLPDRGMRGKTWCDDERCAVNTMKREGRSLSHLEKELEEEGDKGAEVADGEDVCQSATNLARG